MLKQLKSITEQNHQQLKAVSLENWHISKALILPMFAYYYTLNPNASKSHVFSEGILEDDTFRMDEIKTPCSILFSSNILKNSFTNHNCS